MTARDLRDQLEAALGHSYHVERELGRGGMATVFLAQDSKHGRPVALKVLHQDLAASLGPERFRREITLAAKLQHPHILTVLDSGETPDGLLWFTMPYVEGESLRDRLARERQLAVPEALRLAREAALALDYAHRHGVIHRDVKPENILLIDGQAMVADFGIARALGPGSNQTLTETGMALGTPAYMSPEQASGERTIDARTDIYSLGAVLYEMLAGEPPFTGPTAQAVIARRFTERPRPLRTIRDTIAEPVERAVDTALARAPADRFPTAADFAKALDTADRTISAPTAHVGPPPPPPPHPPVAAPRAPSRRRVPVAAAALGLGFLVGVGVLFAWRHYGGAGVDGAAGGPVRLAVLPFDNVGDSADAYFADGLTDAIRGKLTGVPGLAVIAPASSAQYRHTSKTPAQIGQELGGVRYLLIGKVRWAKGAGGGGGAASRVQVSPALVDAISGTDAWEQPFDAPLTDVFQVQADIAGKVAQQLRVRLGTQERHALAERPTENLDAYDAYLRGEAIAKGGNSSLIERRAAQAFARAVRQDSAFALAWAGLARSHALMYSNGVPTPAGADSVRHAAERAVALAPDLPEAHAVMALYYQVVRADYAHAFAEDSIGLASAPNNVLLLTRTGALEERVGRWDAAVKHYEQAARLDPQSDETADRLAIANLRLRRYAAAQDASDRALARLPENLASRETRVMVSLAQGDLAGGRTVLHAAPPTVDPGALAAYVGEYWDLGWVLDSALDRALLGLTPAAFDDSRADWGTTLAEQYALHGDRVHTRAYADSARVDYERLLRLTPDDPGLHVEHGLVLALMGRKAEAIQEGERSVALMPIAKDARDGPYMQHQLVRIYLIVGENERALDRLEPLLKIPYYLSPGWLKIDPTFAPLHGNPRFERLVAGS